MHAQIRVVMAAALSAALVFPGWASAQTLSVGGTGGALAMLRQVGAVYTASAKVQFTVVDSLGSKGAILAAADGALDLAVLARPLDAKEKRDGFTAPLVMRTPFVLATSQRAPESLARNAIGPLMNDPSSKWADGTPVRILLRPVFEGDYAVLFAEFPGTEAAIARARKRGDVLTAATDQDNQDMAAATAGSLIFTSFSQTMLEHWGLHMVPIDGVPPSLEALASGAYPYVKRFWFVLPPKRTAAGEAFVAFLISPQGQRASLRAGLLANTK